MLVQYRMVFRRLMSNDRQIQMTDPILYFRGKYHFLSNFYPSELEMDGQTFPTVEHAYQAAKSNSFTEQEWIRSSATPGIAKRRGREVSLRKDWEEVKIEIMTDLIWLKFEQNLGLRKMLLDTGSVVLVEGNFWHDNIWGACFCSECTEKKGKNMLGFILMMVREGWR